MTAALVAKKEEQKHDAERVYVAAVAAYDRTRNYMETVADTLRARKLEMDAWSTMQTAKEALDEATMEWVVTSDQYDVSELSSVLSDRTGATP